MMSFVRPPFLRLPLILLGVSAAATVLAAPPVPAKTAPRKADPAKVQPAEVEAAPVAPDPRWPFRDAQAAPDKPAVGGVGLVLEAKEGAILAAQIAPGGPAGRAGLQAGDVLLAVDAWQVPPDAKVPEVATHIRGQAGTRTHLTLRRGTQPLAVDVERAPLDRLFPNTSRDILAVHEGYALLASGNHGTLGVRFQVPAKAGAPLTYLWKASEGDKKLGTDGAQSGTGLVSVTPMTAATVQIADWRLDVKQTPDGVVFVAGSNLPVHVVVAGHDWLQLAPPFATYIKPRAAPTRKVVKLQGDSYIHLLLRAQGKPVLDRRVTLRLSGPGVPFQDALTTVTDAQGRVDVAVPPGTWRVLGLQPSTPGGQRDAAFEYELAPGATALALDTSATTPTVLPLQLRGPTLGSVQDWVKDPRVGQGLPQLDVQKWLLPREQPKSLKGQVLLLYVWATWCGPCRATAPMVAEVAARLQGTNLRVVAASIDKDEQALDEYAKDELPGAPTIAWVGPEGMNTLEFESVPTFVVVDAQGRIRGLHRGTGWTVEALETWLRPLLDEALRP
jgi:thiol-disulfide isomerase/thioredoxin